MIMRTFQAGERNILQMISAVDELYIGLGTTCLVIPVIKFILNQQTAHNVTVYVSDSYVCKSKKQPSITL